jgi:hypothetical protein
LLCSRLSRRCSMLNAELDESQAKRDACLERLLERQP